MFPQVWVNQYNVLHNNVPFGGKKQSGFGEFILSLRSLGAALRISRRAGLAKGAVIAGASVNRIVLPGRELGSYALEEYTSVKAVHWNYGEKLDWPF